MTHDELFFEEQEPVSTPKKYKELKVHRYDFSEFANRYDVNIDLLDSILSELPALSDDTWVCGGAVRRTIQKKPLTTDIDFFFKNNEARNLFKDELEAMNNVKKKYGNDQQTTYTLELEGEDGDKTEYTIQLVHIDYYKDIEECMSSFDFSIAQFGYDGKTLYCGEYSLYDLANNRLTIHDITYGVASFRRILKYTSQGFTACSGFITDFLLKVVENPEVINSEIKYFD